MHALDPMSRRNFLQVGTVTLATASIADFTLPAAPRLTAPTGSATPLAIGQPTPALTIELPVPPDERVGFAVMGLGDFALNQILPRFRETRFCKLAALVSGNADKARTVARAYGVPDSAVYSYATFDRIRDNADVHVVYVILPNALHRDWTMHAARAGKHVFCEKPMAPTAADCQQMIDACAHAGTKLGIAYRAPFEPHNREAMLRIRRGEIGTVQSITGVHGRMLDPDKPADAWRAQRALAGGGSLYDIGIYNVNGSCFLLGEDPIEVHATERRTAHADPRIDVETGITWTMRFASGAMASCTSAYDHVATKRMSVLGTDGALELDPATEYDGNRLVIRRKARAEEVQIDGPSQFAAELDHFAESVREKREPLYAGAIGLRDVRIMQAIYESARTGKSVSV